MSELIIHLIIFTIVSSYFDLTEELISDVGYYPEHDVYGVNLPECGLRYVPHYTHKIKYNTKCYGNKYIGKSIVEFAEPLRRKSIRNTSNRIYKGDDVGKGEAPWVVFIHWEKADGHKYFCTGSLITFEWVITAAHCLANISGQFIVVAGGQKGGYGLPIYGNLNQVFYHPNRTVEHLTDRFKTDWYDMAIFKLKGKYDPHVIENQKYMINTICLPEPGKSNLNIEFATVFGFGHQSAKQSGYVMNYLKKFNIELQATDPEVANNPKYNQEMAGLVYGDKPTTCRGDSGGPLVQYINNIIWEKAILVGITVNSSPDDASCSHEKFNAFFKPVSFNMKWILEAIQNNKINS